MNKSMIKVVSACAVALAVGCKSIESIEQLYRNSYTVGAASGAVANLMNIDDTARNQVIEIAKKIDMSMPQTNQTFKAAWTDIAKEHTAELVQKGTIDTTQAEMIMSAFNLVVTGVDYYIDKRHPEVRQYQDMTAAVTHGSIGGFLTTFKPANNVMAGTAEDAIKNVDVELYNEAYNYLKTQVPSSN